MLYNILSYRVEVEIEILHGLGILAVIVIMYEVKIVSGVQRQTHAWGWQLLRLCHIPIALT